MARLNEPPAATASLAVTGENVDAQMRTKSKVVRQNPPADFEEVRRRFIRQNRELAKNNSSQSLRIRSLELEVSRLLSDNLDLRNQVLHLHNELYTAQSQASRNAVAKVKAELRAKMAELNAIMDGIEDSPDSELPEVLQAKRPTEGNWRERQSLTEVMRESQMPTISEDKLYPRRTMGADQFQAIRLSDQSSNDSPELGPPPVSFFDYEDPVKPASPSPVKDAPPQEDEDVLPANLAVNLETRRRRKDSQPRVDARRSSILPQSPVKPDIEQPTSTLLRTGAKRKLADREGDRPIKPPSKGDFTFSRKASGEEANSTQRRLAAGASGVAARKVLGDKSVNLSPRKVRTEGDKPAKEGINDEDPAKRAVSSEAASGRRRQRVSSLPIPSPPRDNVLPTVEIPPPATESESEHVTAEPKTPAALDLFSPTPSEPSARPEGRPEGRGDTPPPADLSTLSVTTDGGEARPSRRARAAVNYAEPSLISKMRRPDKKKVDALSGLQHPRHAMNVSAGKETSAAASAASAQISVTVKEEPVEDEQAWKRLPAATQSPLQQKSDSAADNQVSLRPLSDDVAPVRDGVPVSRDEMIASSTSATISALVAGSRKRRESSQQQQISAPVPDIDRVAKHLEDLDIYEFKESSSPVDVDIAATARPKADLRAKAHQRRHSTLAKDSGGTTVLEAHDDAGDAVEAGSGDSAAGARMRRRRSMML